MNISFGYFFFFQMDSVIASDINLHESSAALRKTEASKVFGAPVSYINIFECSYFTLGVFILKSGVSVPLHDHPGMYGLW